MTDTLSQPESEFAQLPDLAAALGLDPPAVNRKWVNVSDGGHISGVVWQHGTPEVTIVPGPDAQARDVDRIALHTGIPLLVLDLPGRGRSSDSAGASRRAVGRSLSEAVASFAPRTRILVGIAGASSIVLDLTSRLARVTDVVLIGGPGPDDGGVLASLRADGRVRVTVVDLASPDEQIYDQGSVRIADELRSHLADPSREGEPS